MGGSCVDAILARNSLHNGAFGKMEERRDKMRSYAFAYRGRLRLQSNKNF